MNYVNEVELLQFYITPSSHTKSDRYSTSTLAMNTHILIKIIGCVLRELLLNLKKMKALARCNITLAQSVGPT
jgi:hypothetical protein